MRALFAKFVTAVLGAGLLVTANAALACNTGCAPPAPPVRPTPPSSSCGCETPPNNGHHGGSHSSSTSTATASASASAFSVSTAGSASYGGGYGNWSQTPGTPENAGGLVVETGAAAMDMISEKRSVTRTVVIQANCIDDTGVPHPASQLSDEREINNGYAGEVYRCIAGTHMQVTMADFGLCDFGSAAGAAVISDRETSSYSRSESHSSSSMSSGEAYGSGYGSDEAYAGGSASDHGYSHGSGYSSEQSYSSEGGYASGMSGGAVMAGPCAPQAIACSAGGERRVAVERVAGGDRRAAGCLAKTDFSHFNFNGGQIMSCQKGEALWFEHGALTCKVQIPQRQCNERSLLRRFGAGVKVLTMTRVETMQRQVVREASHSASTTMTFDGGVGGFVE